MSHHALRKCVAIVLFSCQAATIALLLVLGLHYGGIDDEELKVSLGLIAPLFAAHVTTIIKFMMREWKGFGTLKKDDSRSGAFPLVALFFTCAFCFAIPSVVLARAYAILSPDSYLLALGAVETLLGVHLGVIVEGLFDHTDDDRKADIIRRRRN